MTTLRIGVASYDDMKARTLDIARGRRKPRPDEPKVWFTSIESMAKILSDRNRALIALIAETHPGSLAELAESSGRAKSNLSRTLRTMERYGLVELRKGPRGVLVPHVPYSAIRLDLAVADPRAAA